MCFPSKWLKKNFSEDRPRAAGSEATKTTETPASKAAGKAADKPTTNGTTVSTRERSKTFKIAIVIYTMYGHIASSESKRSLAISPSMTDDRLSFFIPSVAESVKAGVESAGGSATIYQSAAIHMCPLDTHIPLQGTRNPLRRRPESAARSCQTRLPSHHPRCLRHLRRFPPRYSHSIRKCPRSMEGVLGLDRWPLGIRCSRWEIRWDLRVDRYTRRWTRDDGL